VDIVLLDDHTLEHTLAENAVDGFGTEHLIRVSYRQHVESDVRKRQVADLHIADPRAADVHGLRANAAAFPGIFDVKTELSGDMAVHRKPTGARVEDEMKRTAPVQPNVDENAVVDHLER
jgi:hypothetical protein